MVIQSPPLTVEQFDELVLQPPYIERNFEYVAGEMVEVVSNQYASVLSARLIIFLAMQMQQHNIKGDLTTSNCGYKLGTERYMPDIACIDYEPTREAYSAGLPKLVVEVISNPKNAEEIDTLRKKTTNYLAHDIVVWVVKPDNNTVEVHQSGREMALFGIDDVLTGGDILPGVQIAVRDIFRRKA